MKRTRSLQYICMVHCMSEPMRSQDNRFMDTKKS